MTGKKSNLIGDPPPRFGGQSSTHPNWTQFSPFEQAVLQALDHISLNIAHEAQSTRRSINAIDTHLLNTYDPKISDGGALTNILRALEAHPQMRTRLEEDWVFRVVDRDDSWGIHVKISGEGKEFDLGSDGTPGAFNLYQTLLHRYRSAVVNDDPKKDQLANILKHIRQGRDIIVRVALVNKGGPSHITIEVERNGKIEVNRKKWNGSNAKGISKEIYYILRNDPLLVADFISVHEDKLPKLDEVDPKSGQSS